MEAPTTVSRFVLRAMFCKLPQLTNSCSALAGDPTPGIIAHVYSVVVVTSQQVHNENSQQQHMNLAYVLNSSFQRENLLDPGRTLLRPFFQLLQHLNDGLQVSNRDTTGDSRGIQIDLRFDIKPLRSGCIFNKSHNNMAATSREALCLGHVLLQQFDLLLYPSAPFMLHLGVGIQDGHRHAPHRRRCGPISRRTFVWLCSRSGNRRRLGQERGGP